MKKLSMILAMFLAMTGSAAAKNVKTIFVKEHYKKEIDVKWLLGKDIYDIDSLIVKGYLWPSEVSVIGDMCRNGALTGIDMSDCYIYSGGKIPDYVFSNGKVNGVARPEGEMEAGWFVNLQYIKLPHHFFKGIGQSAFAYTNLRSIEIQRSVEGIDNHAFTGCRYLKEVIVRNPVPPVVQEYAFYNLPEDAVLKVPVGSKERYEKAQGWNAFKTIEESEDAYVVKSVEATGGDLRSQLGDDMYRADSLTVSGYLTAIDFKTLRDNTIFGNLSGLNISGCSVEDNAIPYGAFCYERPKEEKRGKVYAYNLQYVSLPESVEIIDWCAFQRSGLRNIVLPSSLKILQPGSLLGCSDLSGAINFPEGMSYLDMETMRESCNINHIYLPSTLDTLESAALRISNGIKLRAATCDLYVNRMTPPAIKEMGDGYPGPFGEGNEKFRAWALEGWKLYVPVGAKKNYENAEYWNEVPEIIETAELTGASTSAKGIESVPAASGDVEVYTLSGRMVFKGKEMPSLPKGMYVVKTGTETLKTVVR